MFENCSKWSKLFPHGLQTKAGALAASQETVTMAQTVGCSVLRGETCGMLRF